MSVTYVDPAPQEEAFPAASVWRAEKRIVAFAGTVISSAKLPPAGSVSVRADAPVQSIVVKSCRLASASPLPLTVGVVSSDGLTRLSTAGASGAVESST